MPVRQRRYSRVTYKSKKPILIQLINRYIAKKGRGKEYAYKDLRINAKTYQRICNFDTNEGSTPGVVENIIIGIREKFPDDEVFNNFISRIYDGNLSTYGMHGPALPPDILNAAPRYQVGKVRAEVYLDLLGGGNQTYGPEELEYRYRHEWVPLAEAIEAAREVLLAQKRSAAQGKVLFNGPTIRLHSFDLGIRQDPSGEERKRPILEFRPSCWFDYVISNQRIDEPVDASTGTTVREAFADELRLVHTRRVDWVPLSNILTVTVVLCSKDDWVFITRRTDLVDNAAGVLAASAAENMHRWKDEPSDPRNPWSPPKRQVETGQDIDWNYQPKAAPNPFYTAIRGIEEEVGKEIAEQVDPKDIRFIALAWDLVGFNPHLYAYVQLPIGKDRLIQLAMASRADDSWESSGVWVPFEPSGTLKSYLFSNSWAEISKGAVLRTLVHRYGYEAIDLALQ